MVVAVGDCTSERVAFTFRGWSWAAAAPGLCNERRRTSGALGGVGVADGDEEETGESDAVSVCCWFCADGDEDAESVVETASGDAVELVLVLIAIGDGRRERSDEPGGATRPLAPVLVIVTECASGGYCMQLLQLAAPVAHIIDTELEMDGEPGAPLCRVECGW